MIISDTIRNELLSRVRAHHPNEACGLLVRTKRGVLAVIGIKNVHPRPEHNFAFDPDQQLGAASLIYETGMELVGIWHSHTNGDHRPSAGDLDSALLQDSWLVHLIIANEKVYGYELINERFQPLKIAFE